MKSTRYLILFLSVSLFCSAGDFKQQVGISLKGSTNGIGGDIYYRPIKSIAFKVGYEALNASLTAQTLQSYVGGNIGSVSVPMPTGGDMNFDINSKFKTGSLSFLVGFQPFGGLYITAGIGTFLLNADISGTPTNDLNLGSKNVAGIGTVSPVIPKDKIGSFVLNLSPTNKVAPYFGIGLGSFVPRKGRVSFALELGTYYMGAPVISATLPSGLKTENIDWGSNITQSQINQYFGSINTDVSNTLNDLQTKLNTQVSDLNTQLKPFAFYPVLKLTIGIKALEF
jgi:hypothetical protein